MARYFKIPILARNYSTKLKSYEEAFNMSINNPALFWEEHAQKLFWFKKWDKVICDPNSPNPKWFHGGLTNTSYNCLDRHVIDGHGFKTAIIQDSPLTKKKARYTYSELLNDVTRLAGYFSRQCGIKKHDRILIYMPMIPECLVSMLACARIGAIHTVVFGGFSAEQLAVRISNVEPKLIVTASYGVEPKKRVEYKSAVENAIALSGCKDKVKNCIFFNRPELDKVDLGKGEFFIDWVDALSKGQPHDAIPVESEHPLYILHTSGTTGDPKGVVRDNGGYSVALKFVADYVYDIKPEDVWWACSEFGWVVGHSYCAYTPLLQRATSIIYEGKPVGTPDAAQLFRVASENRLCGWFLTPSAIRAIRNEDPKLIQSKNYRLGDPGLKFLRNIFIAGEHCDVNTISWLADALPSKVRITDTWWQTETGWPITSSCFNLKGGFMNNQAVATPLGSAGLPVPGFNIQLTDQSEGNTSSQSINVPETNNTSQNNLSLQRILVKLPLPPGCASTLWKADQRFQDIYFTKYPGYYDTMDLGYRDKDNYLYIVSRADDVINVSGHRLSTAALEEACLAVDGVVDCAVIAIPHKVKGHLPFGVLVVNRDLGKTEGQIFEEVFQSVREHIGPVAAFNQACIVPKLPKTRSGKISRSSLADMAAGKPIKVPVTIDDISAYGPIHEAFKRSGLKPSKVQP